MAGLVVMLVACGALSACGQKGALYLQPAPAQAATPASAPAR